MAEVKTDIPKEGMPHYWYWAKPIEQPRYAPPVAPPPAPEFKSTAVANIGKGLALSAAADIGGDAVKGADEMIKSFAGDEAKNAAREERAQRIAELQGASGQESLASNPQSGVSKSLNTDLKTLQTLQTARANSSISQTGFWSRVDAHLSTIRARYPVGYRDYIDQQASAILGSDPANAKMQSLLGDINSAIASKKSEQDKLFNRIDHARDQGIQGLDHVKELVASGQKPASWADDQLNEKSAIFYQERVSNAEMSIYQNAEKMRLDKAIKNETQVLDNKALTHFRDRDDVAGVTQKIANNMPVTTKEAEEYVLANGRNKAVFMREAIEYGKTPTWIREKRDAPRDAFDAMTPMEKVGGEEAFLKIVTGSASIYDKQNELLTHKDYGLLHAETNLVAASKTSFDNEMWGPNSTIAARLRVLNFAKENLPSEYASGMRDEQTKIGSEIMRRAVKIDNAMRMAQDPNAPRTLADTHDIFHRANTEDPAVYQAIANNAYGDNGLNNSKAEPEARRQNMRSSYDPTNQKFMGYFTTESQLPVFLGMTSPKNTDSVLSVGTEKDVTNYQEWMKHSFRFMFERQVKDLEGLGMTPGVVLKWNDKEHQLEADFQGAEGTLGKKAKMGYLPPSDLAPIRQSIADINAALSNMSYFEKKAGKMDVNSFLLGELTDAGYNIESGAIQNIPQAMVEAIKASRGQTTAQKQKAAREALEAESKPK